MTQGRDKMSHENAEKPVSLAPLSVADALKGLFAIPDPAATKPKPKRRKSAPSPKE